MLLLFDIGNTNTHIGLANDRRVLQQINIPTREWFGGNGQKARGKIRRPRKKSKARRCAASCRARRRTSAKPSGRFGI